MPIVSIFDLSVESWGVRTPAAIWHMPGICQHQLLGLTMGTPGVRCFLKLAGICLAYACVVYMHIA